MTNSNNNPKYPSIFNDVIGPVMRGPSSSHCAAAVRIGRIARDLMKAELKDVLIEFDTNGSLATTHTSQGSDMGILAGFLGWEPTDERVVESPKAIQEAGIHIKIKIHDYGAEHPNTYKLRLRNAFEQHEMMAISTGGGMIEVTQIDGLSLSLCGDYYETLIFPNADSEKIIDFLHASFVADEFLLHNNVGMQLIEIKAQSFLDEELRSSLCQEFDIKSIHSISPVLPVLSRKAMKVPFITCAEMLAYNQKRNLNLWELAVHYESAGAIYLMNRFFKRCKQ